MSPSYVVLQVGCSYFRHFCSLTERFIIVDNSVEHFSRNFLIVSGICEESKSFIKSHGPMGLVRTPLELFAWTVM